MQLRCVSFFSKTFRFPHCFFAELPFQDNVMGFYKMLSKLSRRQFSWKLCYFLVNHWWTGNWSGFERNWKFSLLLVTLEGGSLKSWKLDEELWWSKLQSFCVWPSLWGQKAFFFSSPILCQHRSTQFPPTHNRLIGNRPFTRKAGSKH